jgi:hypothetical protein
MKIVTLLFLTLFLGKGCSNPTQTDIKHTTIEYSAYSRGFYQKIIIQNQTLTNQRDRKGIDKPEVIRISDADWQILVSAFQKINIEGIPNLKDPTQARFYDGAAIAEMKITYKEKTYQTTNFDHGTPPSEIADLVNKIVSLTNKENEN